VSETTLSVNNSELFLWIHPDSVPYWIRITVANYAFDNMEDWVNTYFNYRSGTYNNQWILVDFNAYQTYKNNMTAAQNIVWFAEEFYNFTSVNDVTQALLVPQGYVASYNVPYNATLEAVSHDNTNYTDDPRYYLFLKYAPNVENLAGMQSVMRMNNFSDTNNYCQAISARCDLNNSISFPFGAIDSKVTSDALIGNREAWIIAGPTTNLGLPPFNWTAWPQFVNESNGLPNIFNFEWQFAGPGNFTSGAAESLIHKIDI